MDRIREHYGLAVEVVRPRQEAVLQAAHAAGDMFVELNVNKYNPAKDFYRRHGFTVERDEVIDIGEGYVMDDHVMVKVL